MHFVAVPIYLYILPFILLGVCLKLINSLVKKGNHLRPLALIISLVLGGIWILAGFLIFRFVGLLITSIVVMISGALFLIIGSITSTHLQKSL
jgi:hypothetical protein